MLHGVIDLSEIRDRDVMVPRTEVVDGVTVGFKDLGAGGVSCVTSELCDAGGFGCDVDLALVHQIDDLPARVCACSETQERYGLAVPKRLTDKVLKIYNEDFALPMVYDGACACRIGEVTTERRYVLRRGEEILADASDTIVFDDAWEARVQQRVAERGTDGQRAALPRSERRSVPRPRSLPGGRCRRLRRRLLHRGSPGSGRSRGALRPPSWRDRRGSVP